ncbi:hypothetical protein [Flavobacterium terrigena]|uniref:Uncharacterized protein n=1 Tax=Flavobacterium terrigena TaxID=402734 RepID=A0A1H6XRT3_9FLAO|nr:hypothetical protein [Flavobacterium terrigena]SEJ29477.1 hypothetical protein SAMN05660918_2873 [Flavobacterium terrigena]
MASTSEVGHAKNVANLGTGIQILQEMGTLYNPSNTNIQLTSLISFKAAIEGTITQLNSKIPSYKNAVANREVAIEKLGKTSTKVLNFSKSLNISTTDKENILSQVKKIRGHAKAKAINPETSETTGISTSQMSYDSRIANLSLLINFVASHPEYQPNENDIKVANLQTYQQELSTLSSLVNTAGNELITARLNRNNAMYLTEINIIKVMNETKSYLKSLGQAAQPYYKAFVKLKFRDKD